MTVLVGFIKSPEGAAALEAAIAEARLRNARLLVIHSLHGSPREERELMTYREELERIAGRLESEGIDHEIRELVRGNTPSEDLLEVARSDDVQLLVIGIRRRSPVGKLVLGSNAQDILLGADCPVLAVKARD